MPPLPSSGAPAAPAAGLVATVDTHRVAGVPCLVVPPRLAKRCLQLLRSCGWHPAHHSRLVLDRRPGKQKTSPRAYQLSDEAAILVAQSLLEELDDAAGFGPEGAELLRMVQRGEISWRPTFQLHRYIIDEAYCDHESGSGLNGPEIIRYHPSHTAGPRSGPEQEPEPEPELESELEPDAEAERQPKFLFAELFAGIGGFRVGLEACGGRCVFSSEINPWAKSIYALNFAAPSTQQGQEQEQEQVAADTALPPAEVVAESIQSVEAASVPYHDLLTAGFPCQPFTGTATGMHDDEHEGSWVEQRPRGFRDPRGQLFWHMIRLIRCHREEPQRQPKAILLENVPGLFKNDCTAPFTDGSGDTGSGADAGAGDGDTSVLPSSALPTVLAALTECGYHVTWKQYDACKLVPQSRLRVYIVAIRNDLVATTDAATTTDNSTICSGETQPYRAFSWPILPDDNPAIGSILHRGTQDGGGTLDGVDLEQYRLTPNQWARVGDRIQRGSSNYLFNTRVADPAGVSNTIRASYRSGYKMYSQFVPVVDQVSEKEEEEVASAPAPIPFRFFTPRECARLQGFPDSYQLSGDCQAGAVAATDRPVDVPEGAQYAAIGNAVAPPVIEAIGRALLATLSQ